MEIDRIGGGSLEGGALPRPAMVAEVLLCLEDQAGEAALGGGEAIEASPHHVVGNREVEIAESPGCPAMKPGLQSRPVSCEDHRKPVVLVVVCLGVLVNQQNAAMIEQRHYSKKHEESPAFDRGALHCPSPVRTPNV